MYKTLIRSFSLKITYKVNGIIHALKQLPLIKKLLPASLYSSKGLKAFSKIAAGLFELISALLGKLLYFLIMAFAMGFLYKSANKADLYIHILFFLSIIGALLNTYLFNPTRDKYYAIILLRMDAREYALINYAYAQFKIFIGFILFGSIFGRIVGVPIYTLIIFTLYTIGLKLTYAAYNLLKYEKTGCPTNENAPTKLIWSLVAILLAAAYGLPALNIVFSAKILSAIMIIPIITGILAIRKIYSFKYYQECYKQILQSTLFQADAASKIMRESSNKYISADVSIKSNRTGFEYLNELFIKRHKKLLWSSVQKITLIVLGLVAFCALILIMMPQFAAKANNAIMTSFPILVFIMYVINRGTSFTQILFTNCDHSLLSYPFYRNPKFIIKLFGIRLREIVKINLFPALILGIGLCVLLYISGGTDNVLMYALLPVFTCVLSIFFSVHYLVLYYLLQPYSAQIEVKSFVYQIAVFVTYIACFSCMKITLAPLAFAIGTTISCILYCLVACALVFNLAAKTFKLRA